MHEQPEPLLWSEALFTRFKFVTPQGFRTLEQRGLFRWQSEYRDRDLSMPGDHYLWFDDMEWYQPEALRSFEFQSYHKTGFIPFAHTAGGDYWCWYAAMQNESTVPVLLCPHDCDHADLYAPDFASSLYRHALCYTACSDDDERDEQVAMLRRFAIDLAQVWPIHWRETIERAVSVGMEEEEYERIIADEFGKRYLEFAQVRWAEQI